MEQTIIQFTFPLAIIDDKSLDTEIVSLGKLTSEEGEEGPFVDITGTYDLVRQ